jgi:hypothetical protein
LHSRPVKRQAPAGVDVDGVGRADLRIARPFRALLHRAAAGVAARGPALGVGLGAGHQAVVVGHVVVVGDDHAARRIDGHAAPVRTAVVAGIFDVAVRSARAGCRSPRTWRLNWMRQIIWSIGDMPHICFSVRSALRRVWYSECGWVGARCSGSTPALRHGRSCTPVSGAAGAAVQHVDVALLAGQHHGRDRPAGGREVDQGACEPRS